MHPRDGVPIGLMPSIGKRVIPDLTPFVPVCVAGDNITDMKAVYSAAIPAWKQHGAPAILYILGANEGQPPETAPGMTVRVFDWPRDSFGHAQFIQFKKQVAHDVLEGLKSSQSGSFSIVIASRNSDQLSYFVARWLMEERRCSLPEIMEIVKEINSSGFIDQEYKRSLIEMYGAKWPPPKRYQMKHFPAVENALTIHEIDPRLEALDVRGVGKAVIERLENLSVMPRLAPVKRLTRKFLASISDQKEDYVLLPEPAGKRCICVFDEKRLKMLFVDDRIGFAFEREFPLTSTVVDVYLLDDGALVVSDMRVFEGKKVSDERFTDRQSLIKKHIVTLDPGLFRSRPCYPLHEARWLCGKGFNEWPVRGFSVMKIHDGESFLPVSHLWEFEDRNPLVVSVKVMFSASCVLGQVARWPALVPVVDLGPITERLYELDGQPIVAEVLGRTIIVESHVVLKAQFVRVADASDRVWTFKEFSDTFCDDKPLLSQTEMLGMM